MAAGNLPQLSNNRLRLASGANRPDIHRLNFGHKKTSVRLNRGMTPRGFEPLLPE